ncbi:amino-acid N-acetyltransferase [Psychromonas sp. 14N.309.X.WAT.B.A12]|jgi:amino-acid N-acetyltransferase|uniref:amino-acid N-acetyltransferase n=1 Tax=unclassified Psychromonas TaxID=2614957 RepID=UPI0025B02DAF|nr:amino-acid N-acetyltransferase [Psychromonas sp. 14N.309.X.WAT.B.A12]MDN2663795.1 amino-acid N-acetyltransferase [Psychromonas sp. 14N.309.X.WAT.B.A12]
MEAVTNSTQLINWFRNSAPYINAHRHKTFVLMIGGEALETDNFQYIINDIALLNSLGVKLVLVHGVRPQIQKQLEMNGHSSEFYQDVRITDDRSLALIKQAIGRVQIELQAGLSMGLVNSPMQGAAIRTVISNVVTAQPIGVKDGIDLCHAGKVRRIDVEGLRTQLSSGAIPIISPIGYSVTGEVFNLLAEEVATQVAIALKADKLIGFCSNQGVLDEQGNVISELLPEQAQEHIDKNEQLSGQASGTLRFLRAAVAACQADVTRCHLISYHQDGALLKELFTRDGTGSQIVKESYEQIRPATIDDIGGLLQLIEPLEKQGILVKRSRELLENEIESFFIVERDGMVIGCAALYPFADDKTGELACLVSHPKYRRAARADNLVAHVERKARQLGLESIFVLTTQSIHWFRERGFVFAEIEHLPNAKKEMYNLKRNSKVLVKKII